MAAMGVGAVLGALTLGARATAEPGVAVLLAAAAVACAGLLGLSSVGHVWPAVLLLFVTGFSGIVTVTGCNTALQLAAPEELRGRVMSLYAWIFGGVFPIGSFLVGAPRGLGRLPGDGHPGAHDAGPPDRHPALADTRARDVA
jgi:hypothetical protein